MYNLMPDIHHRPEPSTGGGDDEHLRPSGSGHVEVEREHIFEKVVTPSDVGKLNRLVIPKQHAEKYFPLDSSSNEKELLLNFEDRNGKEWRFRYSYWNSSQSYVMTKGWSRFVKEKKLDAGDIVSFQRGGGVAKDRLFIDWRRRPDLLSQPLPHHFYSSSANHLQYHNRYGFNNSTMVNGNPCTPPGSIFYLRPVNTGAVMTSSAACVGVGGGVQMVYESVPVVHGKAAAKRLRLFGVNMDCPISESDEYEMVSSNSTMRLHHYFPSTTLSPTSSSSIPNSLRNNDDDKGKGSMSLDLDI